MRGARRVCQWGALAILVALPVVSRGGALYQSFGPGASHVDSLATPWESFLYHGFSVLFGGFDDPPAIGEMFQGSYWSITLFGVTFSDPLALLGHALATGSIYWPLAAGALAPVFLGVLAGRAFCGWICPVNTVLEWNGTLRRWLERRIGRRQLPNWTPPLRLRYLLLIAGILISATAGIGAFALMLPYNALARDWHLAVYGAGFGFGVFFLVVLVALELLVAPRLWCRSLCPTGLILGLLGKRRLFGIVRKPIRRCPSSCRLCAITCPVGVFPKNGIDAAECLMCSACVVHCPKGVLAIGTLANRPVRRRAVVRSGVVAVVALLGALMAGPAAAHHIAGLPHYGYLENYPQTPTSEARVSAPPYEVTMVIYTLEGLNREISNTPHDAMIYVTVTEEATGEPYTGKLEMTFRPLDGGAATTRSFSAPLEETVYRTRMSLSAATYDVAFRIGSKPVTVAKLRYSFAGGINGWLLASAGVGVATLAVLGLAMRRRSRRWRAAAHHR